MIFLIGYALEGSELLLCFRRMADKIGGAV